jgi:IMP dehydrogenase
MFTQGYTFDDVLLIPKHSNIESRSQVETSVELPRGIKLTIPLVSANMKTVTGVKMAKTIRTLGGLAILHRFGDYKDLCLDFHEANIPIDPVVFPGAVGMSVGIKPKDIELVKELYDTRCRIFCVDVAHGDHSSVASFVNELRIKHCPNACIIAGNVVTESGANLLWEAGADIIKCGVGSGSTCSTRIETGNGYPQLSALQNVTNGLYRSRKIDGKDMYPMFIADGGIKSAGDCVKALCFADLVMIGNLFAGTDEAPGEIITVNGQRYKSYAGSSTHKQNHVEGVVALVPYKGRVNDVVQRLVEGIKSGCSYQGVSKIQDLTNNPQFVVISNAGLIESHPHNVKL